MEELVSAIEEEEGLPQSQKKEVYATLAKVLGNIVQNPAEPKYRSLKKDNRMVQEKIGRSTAAVSLLLALGFEDEGATYTCPPTASLESMEEVVELIQCVMASREEETGAPSPAVPAPAAAAAPSQPAAQRPAPQPTAATAKSALNPQTFARRDDTEKMRSEQASQLAAVRAAQQAQYSDGGSTPSPSAEAESDANAKKKPPRSAFDFESRARQQEKTQKAADGLQDLRQRQREKFKDFKSDPNAQKSEAYQRPASVAAGGQAQQGWGDWLSGWFGGGGSSGGSGGSDGRPERRGPNVKGIGDLPKPVRRG